MIVLYSTETCAPVVALCYAEMDVLVKTLCFWEACVQVKTLCFSKMYVQVISLFPTQIDSYAAEGQASGCNFHVRIWHHVWPLHSGSRALLVPSSHTCIQLSVSLDVRWEDSVTASLFSLTHACNRVYGLMFSGKNLWLRLFVVFPLHMYTTQCMAWCPLGRL